MVLWEASYVTSLHYLRDQGLMTNSRPVLASACVLFSRVNRQGLSQEHAHVVPTKPSALILSLPSTQHPWIPLSFLPDGSEKGQPAKDKNSRSNDHLHKWL